MKPNNLIALIGMALAGNILVQAQNIIPTPMKMDVHAGTFTLPNDYSLACQEGLEWDALLLIDKVNDITQLTGKAGAESMGADIQLEFTNQPSLGKEGYLLSISDRSILIQGNDRAGVFYGIQSFIQLVEEFKGYGKLELPYLSVIDKPKYPWRMFMFDSGRQYHTMKFLKQYLDHMAMLKMNVFHWHLTENLGWRIEIKKYPKLTEVGSQVAGGPEQQGYYTQEQIREIVAYAAKRNIEVIPEMDVPGHADAALHAYPELTCFREAPGDFEGHHSPFLFCGGRESTYDFLEDVIDELIELFPTDYIHLGGDEAPKQLWDKCPDCQAKIKQEGLKDSNELQLYFSKRLAEYLKVKGKKAIFWEDVLLGDGTELPDNVVIHWWNYRRRKTMGLDKAIERGLPVIAGTNYYTYLFFPVTPAFKCNEQRTFDMRMGYLENPSDMENPHPLVMGMSACMWGDHGGQQYTVDRRIWPRIYVLSEQMWSVGKRDAFEDFYERVKAKYPYLRSLGVDIGPALKEETPEDYQWE